MSPTPPAQSFLAIRCELRRPTVDLACARAILDLHENEIKLLAEQGIFPAWNIARVHPATHGSRTERRFLTRALRDWADSKPVTRDEDFITRLLYGREKPFVMGKYFCMAWNCDSGHMINLVEDKILELVKGTSYGQGRGCTPCITWASAMKFLKDRRIA
jgi:hypothetical protein